MPSYQIRFLGVQAPEPETLMAADVADAVRQTRARLDRREGVSALLIFDGWLVTTLEAVSATLPAAVDDPRFASAGIYVLGGRLLDKPALEAVPDAAVTRTTD